ncbi:MAG: trypsin-like serine protease [Ruminococcaceae bacterium]|nr:trypsin-like serine protease [Oscillospiraceae bacterium]
MDYENQLHDEMTQKTTDTTPAPMPEAATEPIPAPAAEPARDAQQEPASTTGEAPAWYGVSYHGDGTSTANVSRPTYDDTKSRRRFSKRIALCAALVAVCMMLSGLAGFGGYMVADALFGSLEGEQPGGGFQPSVTPGGGSLDNNVYESAGASDYPYSGVTIAQADTSTSRNEQYGSAGNRGTSLISAIAAARDSVVEITTTTVSYRGQLVAGAGSGVIIHADGIIVTNNHVIEGVSSIYVRLTNGNTYEAYLRGRDEENDIAVLKIQPKETLTVAKIAHSSELALGEEVFAIGNPLGELGGTVTNGIISALARQVEMEDGTMTLLQTNAAINSGNSGGGLFNMAGELIGVVNAKYSATGVEGLGFAIPVDTAITTVNALLQYGYIPGRASLGVSLSETNVILSGRLTTIPYVYESVEGSPLQQGDYIYKIGDVVVSTAAELNRAVRAFEVGDTVTLTIFRSGNRGSLEKSVIEVTLVEYVPADSSLDFGQ